MAFGRYRLLSVIGEGGMGKVYKAHDTMMDRDVAIKVLPPEMATEPGYKRRFRREAHIAARLAEPHIIPVYEAGEIDGRLYLAMPIIKGVDLHCLLQRDGPMNPQRAVHIIEQLAAALDAAHSAGLIHRDIKPSNALVTPRDFAYLIDFGIAHDGTASRLTSAGTIMGTLSYMAPERLNDGIADARSDVYALACVLYECLTGHRPFPGDSLQQQVTGHLTMDPPRPSEQRTGVPVGFDEVIAAGMAKKPMERYQGALELAAAARHALTTAPSRSPQTVVRRRAENLPRLPRPVSTAQPVRQQPAHLNLAVDPPPPGLAPLPKSGLVDWPATPVGTPAPPWGQRPRRRPTWPLIAATAVVLAAAGVAGYLLLPDSRASQTPTARPALPSGRTSATSEPGIRVAPTELAGLLLSPNQINAAMGEKGMTAGPTYSELGNDSSTVSDKACLPLYSPAQASVYAGSGWTALRGQQVADHQSASLVTSFVIQNVVSFPSTQDAGTFFTTSTQSWPNCSNRQFTLTLPGKPSRLFNVGPVSNANGTLSVTLTEDAPGGVTCQRALTVASNVVIDAVVCSFSRFDPTNNPVVNIVHQIAAKAPAA